MSELRYKVYQSMSRALFDSDLNLSRDELRLGWLKPGFELSAGYLWIDAVTEEGKLSGLDSFYYSALNADGYTVQIYVGDGASGINVLKP